MPPLPRGPLAQLPAPSSGPAQSPRGSTSVPPLPHTQRGAGPLRQRPYGGKELGVRVRALCAPLPVPSTPGAGLLAGEREALWGNGHPAWPAQHGRAGKKEVGAGEEDFSILPRRSLCLFCCKVVAGLNWNCLSHELIQLLSNLQVHSTGWRGGGGGGSQPQRRRMQSALPTPTPGPGVGWGERMHPTSSGRRAGCTSSLGSAGRAPSPAGVIWGSLGAAGNRSTVPGAKQLVLFSQQRFSTLNRSP